MIGPILIAGIGNVFLGDDGFGCEVARRLAEEHLPAGVRVVDFGIRGLHLAYELLTPPRLLIVLDAVSRGTPPGTLFVIDPELDEIAGQTDAHGMDLPNVFRSLVALGGTLPRTRIIGCEPQCLDETMGLSEPVEQAIEGAISIARDLLDRELTPQVEPSEVRP